MHYVGYLRDRPAGSRRKIRRIISCGVAAILYCLSAQAAVPESARPAPSEAAVKVGIVFNLLKFVQWPAGAFTGSGTRLILCVRSGSDLDGPIDTLANRMVQDRTIAVRRIVAESALGECHAIYHGSQTTGAADLGQRFVLTIGDSPRFAEIGGIFNFYHDGERLRFEINIEAARRAELYLGADLLRLARIVGSGRT
jgi:YfiR/HmsC-like